MARNIKRKMLVLGMVLILALGMSSVVKGEGDPVAFTAIVHKSDGTKIGSEFDGTKATVIVIDLNTGEETKYETELENGYVITSIPKDVISNSKIRIKIDASVSGWDDANYYVHAKDDLYNIDIVTVQGEVEGSIGSFDVQTYKHIPLNLKPIIALIFIILILLFGYLFLAALHRQKVNVAVTSKERVTTRTPQGLKESWKYKCSYGEPGNLTEIGEFSDEKDHAKSSILKMSVRKIVKQPDDSYGWYRPKALDMTRMPQEKRPTEVDNEEKIDKAWFQGGSLAPRKGQTMKSASQRYTHRLFVAFVYPFLIIELIFGVGSLWIESFQFPPSVIIFIINLLVLVIALIFQVVWLAKSRKEEKPKVEKPGVQPGTQRPPEEPAVEAPPKEAPKAEMPKEEPAKPVVAPPKAAPEKKACPNCGQEIGADFVVCPFCGAELK